MFCAGRGPASETKASPLGTELCPMRAAPGRDTSSWPTGLQANRALPGGSTLARWHKRPLVLFVGTVRAAHGFARSLFVQSEGYRALIAQYRDAPREEKDAIAPSRTYGAVIVAADNVPMSRTYARLVYTRFDRCFRGSLGPRKPKKSPTGLFRMFQLSHHSPR